jgi:hypothetical protein
LISPSFGLGGAAGLSIASLHHWERSFIIVNDHIFKA